MVKRIEYIKQRLERWQSWFFSPSGRPWGGGWMIERVDCAVQFGECGPEICEEAIITDQAVGALPPPLKKTVKFVYLDNLGNSMEGHAQQLGVSRDALHKRLCHADLRIDIWLGERQQAAEAARAALAK